MLPRPPLAAHPSLLAHQGGWDEIALVGFPLLLVAVALVVANRRATARLEQQGGTSAAAADPDD